MDKYGLLVKELEWLKGKIEDASGISDGEIVEKIREIISNSGEESIDELLIKILINIGG
jgi:hypothetical protein